MDQQNARNKSTLFYVQHIMCTWPYRPRIPADHEISAAIRLKNYYKASLNKRYLIKLSFALKVSLDFLPMKISQRIKLFKRKVYSDHHFQIFDILKLIYWRIAGDGSEKSNPTRDYYRIKPTWNLMSVQNGLTFC